MKAREFTSERGRHPDFFPDGRPVSGDSGLVSALRAALLVLFVMSGVVHAVSPLTPPELEAAGLEADGIEPLRLASSLGKAMSPGNVIDAELVAIRGQSAGDSEIYSLRLPTTNSSGDAGFNGMTLNSDDYVWFDPGVTWFNSNAAGVTLTGGENTMGIGDNGAFIYSPAVDGKDAVWTDNGLLLVEETQAPDFPEGTISTFHSRPAMIDDGTAFWVSGFNESGGTFSEGRMLYRSPDGTSANTTVVLRSDDVIDSFAIDRPFGVGFNYDFSEDGQHHIHVLVMDTGSSADDVFLYVDGRLVLRESTPTGAGDNWDNFSLVSINNLGDYVLSGDTDGATASDGFIAANGTIVIREGDVLDGIPLTGGASVDALSLAENGKVAFIWKTPDVEALFVACSPATLGRAVALMRTGDHLDLDGDGSGDGALMSFNASASVGPGLNLAPDGTVVVNINLDRNGAPFGAIVRLGVECNPPTFKDGFESID